MATHSSILAWKSTWMEEPGGLQPMRLQRVGHKQTDSACTHTKTRATSEPLPLCEFPSMLLLVHLPGTTGDFQKGPQHIS